METVWNELLRSILDAAIDYFLPILFSLIMTGVVAFSAWIGSKIADNKILSQRLANIAAARKEITNSVLLAVGRLEQTSVEGMKALSENGKLSEEQIKKLSDDLRDIVYDTISDAAFNLLKASAIDIEQLITSNSEAWIGGLRNGVALPDIVTE